jgi:hypothetical protein
VSSPDTTLEKVAPLASGAAPPPPDPSLPRPLLSLDDPPPPPPRPPAPPLLAELLPAPALPVPPPAPPAEKVPPFPPLTPAVVMLGFWASSGPPPPAAPPRKPFCATSIPLPTMVSVPPARNATMPVATGPDEAAPASPSQGEAVMEPPEAMVTLEYCGMRCTTTFCAGKLAPVYALAMV